MTAIAIVGMACRYPDATSPEQLWQSVLAKRQAFRPVPAQRLPQEYRGGPDEVDRTYLTRAAYLADWTFDRQRFSVPHRVYQAVDLTHWLTLEIAAAVLADAGFASGNGLDRSRVGVILGNSLTGEFSRAAQLRYRWPFVQRAARSALAAAGAGVELIEASLAELQDRVQSPFPAPTDESLAGALSNTIAGRVCNHFDFGGGGYTVDGACSSSLLAVISAARALACGEVDFALAGGVDLSLDPFELIGFSRLGALATDDMRVFDAEPTGFLPGEGCGLLALIRAEDARAADLRVYAEIRGWGISSDGSGGITRPRVPAQVQALTAAHQMAGLAPDDVHLIEGHGTGTAVGDEVEISALNAVRGRAPAALGSIKANIGHTKAAAGAASLIKAITAIHRRILPPSTGTRAPHPALDPAGSGLRVPVEAEPWPTSRPAAGVSSMGFGGINTHVLLASDNAPVIRSRSRLTAGGWQPAPSSQLIAMSAPDWPTLAERLRALADHAGHWSSADLGDVAATATGDFDRNAGARCGLVCDTPAELVATASAAAEAAKRPPGRGSVSLDPSGRYLLGSGRPARLGLLFPGQAAPVRLELPDWARPLSVPPSSSDPAPATGTSDTAMAQPAILRQSLVGIAWLRQLNVDAEAVVGHSLGELAALSWAGALSAEQALRLAEVRGRTMAEHGMPGTGLLAVAAGPDTVAGYLDGGDAVLSCLNGDRQTVIGGSQPTLTSLARRLAEAGIEAHLLPVSHAFHSPAMAAVVEPMRRELARHQFAEPAGLVISTVTGAPVPAGTDVPALLVRQLIEPVRFTEAVRELAARCDLLLEVGPGRTLTGLAAEQVAVPVLSIDCGGAVRSLALAAAALAAAGQGEQLGDWFGQRAWRPRPLDYRPQLLSNPCETGLSTSLPMAAAVTAMPSTAEPVAAEPTVGRVVVPVASEPQPAASGQDVAPLELIRQELARRTELPLDGLGADSSPLRDLHVSSLELRHVVQAVCARLDRELPAAAMNLSEASIGDIALVLDALPAAGSAEPPPLAGVRPWVALYEHRWQGWKPEPAVEPTSDLLERTVADGAPLSEIAEVLAEAVRRPGHLVLRHRGHPAAAAVGRSIAVEVPDSRVTVIDESAAPYRDAVSSLACEAGYRELRTTASGDLEQVCTVRRRLGADRDPVLDAGDLVLVTGGATGITARCAAQLAVNAGADLVVLGRRPADDPAVAAALDQLRSELTVRYLQCELTDPASVGEAVQAAGQHGPVRALLHGAAINEPHAITGVDAGALERAWRPKVAGLTNLLAATGDSLRLVIGFGSVIGRFGLPGEAAYAIANDMLRSSLEQWAEAHPACRVRAVEWSVWAELGMGVRLDTLDELCRRGVEPIQPTDGIELCTAIADDPSLPVTVLATGRFPLPVTSNLRSQTPAVVGRFLESTRLEVPGAELITDCELSAGADRYLDAHRIDGVAVLPAVLQLEAFAQASEALDGPRLPLTYTDVAFPAPIEVTDGRSATLRLAALAAGPAVEVVARAGSDRFVTDRGRARLTAVSEKPTPQPVADPPVNWEGPDELYDSVLFHRGCWQAVRGYELLSAYRIRAWLRAADVRWFSSQHDQRLRLGNPALHDAALHALLPAVPLRLALPLGCDSLTVFKRPDGWLRVAARELSHDRTDFYFDLTVSEPGGDMVARWSGLRLRAAANRTFPNGVPLSLAGAYLSRLADQLGLGRIELVSGRGRRADGAATRALTSLLGQTPGHTPQGRLTVPDGMGWPSASYLPDAVIAGVAPVRFGIDWQRVESVAEPDWERCLTSADRPLLDALADLPGIGRSGAAARLWCAREAVRKASGDEAGPLTWCSEAPSVHGAAGTLLLRAGRHDVLSTELMLVGGDVVACAVAVRRDER